MPMPFMPLLHKATRWIVVLSLILVSVAGCSKPPQGTPGGEAPAVISVWYALEGQAEQELLKQLARIDQARPEVIVKGEAFPENTIVHRIWSYQAGGEGPDLIIARRAILKTLYEKGGLAPLLLEEVQGSSGARSVFTFNQQLIAAPWLADIPVLYYRKDLVANPAASMAGLLESKTPLAVENISTALLSPWYNGKERNDLLFAQSLLALQAGKTLIIDPQARDRFLRGEVSLYLGWASEHLLFDQQKVSWGSINLQTDTAETGKATLERSIGIANSSIKSTSDMASAISLVEQELLSVSTEEAMSRVTGMVPINPLYYKGLQAGSPQSQWQDALDKAYDLEGAHQQWEQLSFQDQSWRNILAGADVQKELNALREKTLLAR